MYRFCVLLLFVVGLGRSRGSDSCPNTNITDIIQTIWRQNRGISFIFLNITGNTTIPTGLYTFKPIIVRLLELDLFRIVGLKSPSSIRIIILVEMYMRRRINYTGVQGVSI